MGSLKVVVLDLSRVLVSVHSERLGMAPAAGDLEHTKYTLVAADRHTYLFGGSLDTENQHDDSVARLNMTTPSRGST